jgi:UDP-3-O-[3-hydroxymyristoyl] N-acetylglucosamine deacetylase/3-hydroxyacyl-[acyl-carrier-protein] dehydratase
MEIMVKQKTIKTEVSLTELDCTGEKKWRSNLLQQCGFTFVRVDLEGQPVVEADANYVVNTQRGTNLEKLELKFKPWTCSCRFSWLWFR